MTASHQESQLVGERFVAATVNGKYWMYCTRATSGRLPYVILFVGTGRTVGITTRTACLLSPIEQSEANLLHGYANRSWRLPDAWSGVAVVDLSRITLDGCVPGQTGVPIAEGRLVLSLAAGEALSIVPASTGR